MLDIHDIECLKDTYQLYWAWQVWFIQENTAHNNLNKSKGRMWHVYINLVVSTVSTCISIHQSISFLFFRTKKFLLFPFSLSFHRHHLLSYFYSLLCYFQNLQCLYIIWEGQKIHEIRWKIVLCYFVYRFNEMVELIGLKIRVDTKLAEFLFFLFFSRIGLICGVGELTGYQKWIQIMRE